MKVEKLIFIDHPVFKGHTIDFSRNGEIPLITYLVGNNGSGKTKILDAVYQNFAEPFNSAEDFEIDLKLRFTEQEIHLWKLKYSVVIQKMKRTQSQNLQSFRYENGETFHLEVGSIAKVVYSTVEVNFADHHIQTTTSKNIDEQSLPKEKSQNLSAEIPQLLVDIKALDDSELAARYKELEGKKPDQEIPKVTTRLERFTNAFHKVFGHSKIFTGIDNLQGTKRILFTDAEGLEVGLNNLSTGEKQIIFRIGYILKNMGSLSGGIILIDEPEISLHPQWQSSIKHLLIELFKEMDMQIIIATHSPYIFQEMDDKIERCLMIDKRNEKSSEISLFLPGSWTSINLINYVAYGIVSIPLHIELYTRLQIMHNRDKITDPQRGIENWLMDDFGGGQKVYKTFDDGGKPKRETIMTWIRNKIHHGDNEKRPMYSKTELEESIKIMLELLKK